MHGAPGQQCVQPGQSALAPTLVQGVGGRGREVALAGHGQLAQAASRELDHAALGQRGERRVDQVGRRRHVGPGGAGAQLLERRDGVLRGGSPEHGHDRAQRVGLDARASEHGVGLRRRDLHAAAGRGQGCELLRMRGRVEHQHVGGALAQDLKPRKAVVVGHRDDAVAVGLERPLQHGRISPARADDQRVRPVAARIGQRRKPPLDICDEHDDRLSAAGQRRQCSRSATGPLGQRHRHGLPRSRHRPGDAEPGGRCDLDWLTLGPRNDVAHHEPRRECTAPVVDLEAADDVVTRARVQHLRLSAPPPGHGAAVRRGVGDLQPQVLAALAHALDPHELRSRDEQVDGGVAVTAGLEARELAGQVERDLADGDDGVDHRAAHGRALGQVLRRVRPQGGREGLDGAGRDAQAGGRAMAAEALEVSAAGGEARVQVVGRDGAATALATLALERDQDDRARMALDEARGDDADHALVPALSRGHENVVAALECPAARDLRRCGAQDRVLDPLALAVAGLELLGQRLGFGARRREQEVERESRVTKPARRVDARCQAEAEVGRTHASRVDTGARHQRAEAGAVGLGEASQAAPHQRAVLVGERDDVGDRRQRHQIGELVQCGRQHGRVAAVPARPQRLGELEHDACAAQVGEWIGRSRGGARGHDRGIGQHVPRAVMVGHDDVESELAGASDRFGSGDAAVDRDQQAGATGGQRLDRLDRDPVTVLEATGEERLDVGVQQPQYLDGEGRGAHSVDVVIAVDDERPAGGDGVLDQDAGLFDIPQLERVVQRAVALEERLRRGRIGQAAPHEHLCGDALHAEFGGEPAHLVGAARGDRERRGHPANLGFGPDAAPPGQRWTSTCRMRPSSSRSRGAGPW